MQNFNLTFQRINSWSGPTIKLPDLCIEVFKVNITTKWHQLTLLRCVHETRFEHA